MEQKKFIGRKAELQRLEEALKKACDGQSQVVFIAGEAGVGKSSLAEEFIREQEQANSSLVVSVGQCNAQTGSGDPYLPFRQILTSLAAGSDEQEAALKSGKAKNAEQLREFVRISSQTLIQLGPDLIGIFVPGASLLARLPTLLATNSKLADKIAERVAPRKAEDATKVDPALDQEKIFEQYAAVLKALAQDRPLLLLLDDLQWADKGSLNLLFHLARELKESRILLLGTYRPDDVSLGRDGERHPFESILNELKRYFGEIVIDLSRSSRQEGRAFSDALIDSEPNRLGAAFRDSFFARTGGHPLFAVELLRNLQERGCLVKDQQGDWIEGAALDWGTLPARVEGVIGERIARLPAGLHETLTTASAIGFDFAAQVVARVQRVAERELVRDISRELEKRYRLVLEQGESRVNKQNLSNYRFSHALLQQYLYDELGAGERRLLHGDIAEALESIAGDAAGQFALQLARHYDEAGNPEKAIPYWFHAGDAAFASYAQNEAISAYTRALDLSKDAAISLPQQHHLYTRRGRALELNGQFEQALQNYGEMLAAARACQDHQMELDAQVATSTLYSTPTSVVDAAKERALSQETLRLAQELGDQAVESKVLWNLLLANLQDSESGPAIEYGERSLVIARALNLREQTAYTISDLGWAYNVAGRFEEAERRLIESTALWKELGNMPMLTNSLNGWLLTLLWTGRYEKALTISQESLEISRATRNIWNQGWPHNVRGQVWLEFGEIDRALDEMQASIRLAEQANTPAYAAWYRANLCTAYIAVGAVEKGLPLYRAVRLANEDVPISPGRLATLVCYAVCEIAAGELDLAAQTLDACRLTNSVWDYPLKLAQSKLALARKDSTNSLVIADDFVDSSRRSGFRQYLPDALFVKGQSHRMRDEMEPARNAFEDARVAAEAIGSRLSLWRILGALAEVAPDQQTSAAFRAQAREVVQFISDHTTGDDVRVAFMQSEGVRGLMP